MFKKMCIGILAFVCLFSLSACSKSYSPKQFDAVSAYVLENLNTLSSDQDLEFFDYNSSGLAVGGTYYGYYYSVDNIIVVPDYYDGILEKSRESDGGTYFTQANDGGDWCFVKQITDHWFYYELHWG